MGAGRTTATVGPGLLSAHGLSASARDTDERRILKPCFVPATDLLGTYVELTRHVAPDDPGAASTFLRRRLAYLRGWE